MVERRDHVRTTFLSFARFIVSIFTIRCPSTNAPFFVDLAISNPLRFFSPATGYRLQAVLLASPRHNKRIGPLVVPGLVPPRRLSPRRHRMASARSLALTAAVWMIDRVHGHAAVRRANPQPPIASRLADRNIFVIGVAHLPNRCHA